jgi:hypothetical protein
MGKKADAEAIEKVRSPTGTGQESEDDACWRTEAG